MNVEISGIFRKGGNMPYVPGIDVSGWEPNIDWRAVRASGVRFAFLKATEGTHYVDPTFAPNWVNTKRVGIIRGAYHYLRGGVDGAAQADFFLKQVKLEEGDLPPVLDVENIYNEDVSNQTMIARAEAWLKKVEADTGVRPIIYSGPYFLKDRMFHPIFGTPNWAKNYKIWLANYLDHYQEGSLPLQPKNWQNWLFWQYTDKGIVPGIEGGVDLNWFRGSLDDLYALAGGKEPEPAKHIVKTKDTISSVAKQYGVTVFELIEANPQLLKEGAVLDIPIVATDVATTNVDPGSITGSNTGTSSTPPGTDEQDFITYKVQEGDNLSFIAVRFNTTVDKIAAANGITNPNIISVGKKLKIPKS